MATPEDINKLRLLVGEPIPEGGAESDTMFTDQALGDLLDNTPNMQSAAYQGWKIKAANYANLVNVTDGAAVREMGALLDNALAMVKLYTRSSETGLTDGRTRIGRIRRS